MLLENDSFLSHLSTLLSKTRSSGSVTVTLKRYNGQSKPKPRTSNTGDNQSEMGENRCLFRASNGKKKLATVVMHKDVNKFQQAYGTILKAGMDSLKKRDKTKRAKVNKATQ